MKVVFVVGTTASGKSDLALTAAESVGGAIVNCDSIQVYQGLKIGSALPSNEDFRRVPHYLFSYVPEGVVSTAGDYAREFFKTLESIGDKYPYVFVVGGTGFYFQAIEKGMFDEGVADPAMKERVEAELASDPLRVYEEMIRLDPSLVGKIFPNDHYRIGRAVELMRVQGRPLSEIKAGFVASSFPYPLLKTGIGIFKEELLPRVEARVDRMLAAGLVDEVRALLSRNSPSWKPLLSVGYAEVQLYLRGELAGGLPELRSLIVQNTMRLAKKQRTWFKRDSEVSWFRPGQTAEYLSKIRAF